MVDSRPATYKHIQNVQRLIGVVVRNLLDRAEEHDQSKLTSPEIAILDEFTPLLGSMEYGSDEYKATLAKMKPGLDHHYATNRHHPEYHTNGIVDMTLIDMLEMICDWMAAALRHPSGDVRKSIEINQHRFGYSDELKQILLNTVDEIDS